MNTSVIMILVAIAGVALIIYLATRETDTSMYPPSEEFTREPEEQVSLKDLERKEVECPNEVFRIAGITHYCSWSDVGVISGEARRDPENEYDKKAVIIVEANKEKILGHIAKVDQPRFYKLVGQAKWIPFVGYIEDHTTEEGKDVIYGVIRVYMGDETIMMQNAERDWEYLQNAYRIKDLDDRAEALNRFKY